MRTHATSYMNGLIDVLANTQFLGKYVDGYCVCVGEDGYLLLVNEVDCDEE